jgi:hypothetical protein
MVPRGNDREGIKRRSTQNIRRVKMKKAFIATVAFLFILVAMATAHAASYTTDFNVTGDFNFSGYDTSGPLTLALSGITGPVTANFPPAGRYNWSIDLRKFAVDLNGDGDTEFSVGPLAPIDMGNYDRPALAAPGSTNLGDVTIPFSIFGVVGGDSLDLNDLTVAWDMPAANSIIFTVTAADMAELKQYLKDLNSLAKLEYANNEDGIAAGSVTFDGALTATSVPEPSTVILLGLGLIGLMGAGRKRARK